MSQNMRTIMASRTPQDHNTFSFSRRYFHFNNKKKVAEDYHSDEEQHSNNMREMLKLHKSSSSSSSSNHPENQFKDPTSKNPSLPQQNSAKPARKKLSILAVSKLKTALALNKARAHFSSSHGTKVIGTLFGHRRGHVLLSFQQDFKVEPSFIVELATPTSVLVKEMASGLVRIALECDKKVEKRGSNKLLEETFWRTYCNGKKCGYAIKRECGVEEWKVLNSIGQISMGAGVLPVLPAGSGHVADGNKDGEIMYMRAKFERVVGNRDSEAFYMMNPDGNGGPELSVYLLRV